MVGIVPMPPAKKAPAKAAPKQAVKKAPQPSVYVPDTSVLVDGRLTQRIQRGDVSDCRILIPLAAMAELEFQANRGRESGFAGLDEVVKIQELKETADLEVVFAGPRPSVSDIELAKAGEIDSIIRQVAVENGAVVRTQAPQEVPA